MDGQLVSFSPYNQQSKGGYMLLPNVEIKKILYATDLSESARYAYAYAVSLADHYCASITLVHVLHDAPGFIENLIGAEKYEEIKQRHFDEAREALIGKRREHVVVKDILDKFCDDVRADKNLPDVTTDEILISEGNPAEQILQAAEERDCDLIVIGTHGFGGIAEAMIGGTARQVLRRSRKPVLAVRLPE
jgi:nucleotide-binding universal stress UspA family protein